MKMEKRLPIPKVASKWYPPYCQAQGPTLGPTLGPNQGRVKVKVKVRTWSGHGQVMVRSGLTLTPTQTQKWDLSYTLNLVFTTHHHHSPLTTPSLNQCLERRVLSKSCLYHHDGPQ